MKFSRPRRSLPNAELTPLIDVVFLLLIFFAVSTSFATNQGIRVDLPRSQAQESVDERTSVRVSVDEQGRIFLDERPVDMDTLRATFREAARNSEGPTVVIRADKRVPHGLVVRIMDLAQTEGLRRLSVATDPGP